jgi:hypothetical protein
MQNLRQDRTSPTFATPASEHLKARLLVAFKRLALVPAILVALLGPMADCVAFGAESSEADPSTPSLAQDKPMICENQTYALCAGASCFVFNDVAYCTCNVKKGRSISSSFKYDGGNICTLNAEGPYNGYMASTFSPPPGLAAGPGADKALYTCPISSRPSYAKCDGGLCFTSTAGRSFPPPTSFGYDQIVCACPIEKASPPHGVEIIGPYPCQKSFRQAACERATANNDTGSTVYDGTSIGSTATGTFLLTGKIPRLNNCP